MTAQLDGAELYLDLLKKVLTGALQEESDYVLGTDLRGGLKHRLASRVGRFTAQHGIELVRKLPYDATARTHGLDRPGRAESMIGLKRMDNIRFCVESVLADEVPGDLIETGVWRGGATIFMRALLRVHGDSKRTVWVADSFQGLPPPDPARYAADAGDTHYLQTGLQVGLMQVQDNFRRYGLLDEQVKFLAGWFKDTLPDAPFTELAVIRLDGDMYESTIQAIENTYPKLSVGGYCIVDDYGQIAGCRQAIHDYRAANGIDEEIQDIDGTGVFWRKLH